MIKTLQIANGFFLITTIVFNYLSNTGVFNGKTIGNVSADNQNLFTPAGYAFSIWGLIYLLLIGFVFYTGRSLFNPKKNEADELLEKIGWWFVISCLANCTWIVLWLYGYTGLSVIVMVVFLLALLKILWHALLYNSSSAQNWFINIPFQIYAGWVSVALIAATAAWLKKIDWNGWGVSEVNWTIILIIIASFIHIIMIWKKNAPFFALVAVWALIAIAVVNKAESQVIYFAALSTAGIIFVSSCWKIFSSKLINAQ